MDPHFNISSIYRYERIRNRFRQKTENPPQNIRGYTDIFLQCIEARPRSGADGRSLVSRDTVVEILQECVSIFSTSDLNQRFLSVNSPELGLGLGLARQITRSQLTSFKSYCPHRDRQTRTQTD